MPYIYFLFIEAIVGSADVAALSGYERQCIVLHILFIDINFFANAISFFSYHFNKIKPRR